jgi:prepilin-type N-terminal cleavage/methylation domain-containing protein
MKKYSEGFTPLEIQTKTNDDLRKRQRRFLSLTGFTLIELVMVIVIVGILAALVVPRFESFYSIKLSGAVKKVVSDIRYTQQLAVSRHETYKIIFDTSLDKYEVRRASDNSLAKDPFSRADFVVNFNTDPQYKGINLSSAAFGGTATLQFNWQGIPQDGNGINLSSDGQVELEYHNNSLTIYVTPRTGRVRIE